MLYTFSGLPGTGKSTLAFAIARIRGAVYLRVDTIEQAVKDSGITEVGSTGYLVSYAIASENLRLGIEVVVDSVNPIELTRKAWRDTAKKSQKPFIEIEVKCSDLLEHRKRVEQRTIDIAGLKLPTWQQVIERNYIPWETERIVIDTAGDSVDESISKMREILGI